MKKKQIKEGIPLLVEVLKLLNALIRLFKCIQ